jgi:hypothetical protein
MQSHGTFSEAHVVKKMNITRHNFVIYLEEIYSLYF